MNSKFLLCKYLEIHPVLVRKLQESFKLFLSVMDHYLTVSTLVDSDVIHVMKCSQARPGSMRVDLAIGNRASSTAAVLMTLSLSLFVDVSTEEEVGEGDTQV